MQSSEILWRPAGHGPWAPHPSGRADLESLDIDRQVFFIVSIRPPPALLIPPPPDKGVPAGIVNFALAHRQEVTPTSTGRNAPCHIGGGNIEMNALLHEPFRTVNGFRIVKQQNSIARPPLTPGTLRPSFLARMERKRAGRPGHAHCVLPYCPCLEHSKTAPMEAFSERDGAKLTLPTTWQNPLLSLGAVDYRQVRASSCVFVETSRIFGIQIAWCTPFVLDESELDMRWGSIGAVFASVFAKCPRTIEDSCKLPSRLKAVLLSIRSEAARPAGKPSYRIPP
ncbi:hypothetical protein CMEL01_01314 [Colletotrichum melonis]|uniref:Uncharacterized protein n=1 Tax=Colletotrichum melonis TaxID=1209925 RepID=A0AAI9V2V3_9PEZI|nr:hypothetical protein CMEL01_01314 [Colletotrichum melonis]